MRPYTCPLDVVPSLLRDVVLVVAIIILFILYSYLTSGSILSCFKDANALLLIKMPRLDSSAFNNFRPMSKLPFGNIVFNQQNNILEKFRFSFRAHHGTESALLKVSIVDSDLRHGDNWL